MSNPIKHHYIPQSILSNFCNAEGLLCIFNKQINKRGKRRHPAAVCYEENLHTIIHDNKQFTEIELFYSQIEEQFIRVLKEFHCALKNKIDINQLRKNKDSIRILSYFLTTSFWRIPRRIELAKEARTKLREIYDRAPKENKEQFKYNRKFIRDLERKNASASIKIAQFYALPILLSNANSTAIKECWFQHTEFDQVIADDPVVCNIDENFMLTGEIYIPIDPRLCITNSPNKIVQLHEEMVRNSVKIVMANSEECFSPLLKIIDSSSDIDRLQATLMSS